MAATDFVTETQIDSLVTNIATAVKTNRTDFDAHIADTTDAHDASAISVLDAATQLTATNVETALAEIMDYAQTKTDDSAVTAHIADATAAHAASAISVADSGAHLTATDVEAALAEIWAIADAASGGGVVINDAATNTTNAWSSQKISDYIAAAVAALIDGAPGALDTLNELAAAINDDASFTATVTTALGLRVRVDAAQSFTSPQKAQGLANLGIVASTVNFASNFNTAIA
jgi:hypothetical protein